MKSIPEQIFIQHFIVWKYEIFILVDLVACFIQNLLFASSIHHFKYFKHSNVHSFFICINEATPLHYMILKTASKMISCEQDTQLQGIASQKYLQNKKSRKQRKESQRQTMQRKQMKYMWKVLKDWKDNEVYILIDLWKKIIICGMFSTRIILNMTWGKLPTQNK